MLIEWGQQNHKINDLFCALSEIRQYRAMSLLKDYGKQVSPSNDLSLLSLSVSKLNYLCFVLFLVSVSSQYHHLLPAGDNNTRESPISKNPNDSLSCEIFYYI